MNQAILGCIADDLTGATDLANNLVRAGMRVVLTIDVPAQNSGLEADAIVVALKSRTIPASQAVAQSLHACRWLRAQGVRQIYFKICSTFDSTPQGNIGPVIDALMDELDCKFSVVAPAFPENNRTVYRGHLFVDDVLLSESGMRNHPLNPMIDANLVRFLQLQFEAGKRRTGLIGLRDVAASASRIRARMTALGSEGVSVAIADTVCDEDLYRLAEALRDEALVTAGSGLAIGLPAQWGIHPSHQAATLHPPAGRRAILSGSCSVATNRQVLHFLENGGQGCRLDPRNLVQDLDGSVKQTLAWAESRWQRDPQAILLVYSTAEPESVESVHEQMGIQQSGEMVERALAAVARALVAAGAAQMVIAGGETAGVCMRALQIEKMQIGRQIDPGVPWCSAACSLAHAGRVHIALKSGNFGSPDFFAKAFTLLD